MDGRHIQLRWSAGQPVGSSIEICEVPAALLEIDLILEGFADRQARLQNK